MKGIVKWFNDAKGYGFIKPIEDNLNKNILNKDIFVHFSDIEKDGFKSLIENTLVEFELNETERGIKANHVKLLNQ